MPSVYEQPSVFALAALEDKDKFERLPFYLIKQEIKRSAKWNIFDQLFGSVDWKTNMGTVMRGVRPEPSPIMQTFCYPNSLQVEPTKNVYEVNEASTQASLRWQDFDTKNFTFHPSFQDFWEGQVKYKSDDMTRQIQIFNNMFVRTVLWQSLSQIGICGVADLQGCPWDAEGITDVKNEAFRQLVAQQCKGPLTLKVLNRFLTNLREDQDAPPFNGTQNQPGDNSAIKDKFVLLTSTETYNSWIWDESTHLLKDVNLDLLFNGFNGSLWGQLTCKFEKYPIRFTEAGVIVHPQIEKDETAEGRGIQVIPNPDYTNPDIAKFEVNWLLGADICKSIRVGAPPAEFVKKDISQKKLYEMNWNGRVFITDQVVKYIVNATGAVTSVETNARGRWLRLIATAVCGCLVTQPRYGFPIICRRTRPPVS